MVIKTIAGARLKVARIRATLIDEVKPVGDVSWSVGEDRKAVSEGWSEAGAVSGEGGCAGVLEGELSANPS